MQREAAQQEKMSHSTCEPLTTWSQLWGLSGGGRGAHRAAEQGGQAIASCTKANVKEVLPKVDSRLESDFQLILK